jgi:hypothetical protein
LHQWGSHKEQTCLKSWRCGWHWQYTSCSWIRLEVHGWGWLQNTSHVTFLRNTDMMMTLSRWALSGYTLWAARGSQTKDKDHPCYLAVVPLLPTDKTMCKKITQKERERHMLEYSDITSGY